MDRWKVLFQYIIDGTFNFSNDYIYEVQIIKNISLNFNIVKLIYYYFYILVLPISLIMKLLNYDLLKIKLDKNIESYKIYSSKLKIDLKRIF